MKVNPSFIKTWMNCQQQAKFRYVDGLRDDRISAAAEFGTAVHLAVEDYNTNEDLDHATQVFLDAWEQALTQDMDWPNRTSPSSYKAKGLTMVQHYHEHREQADDVVIAQEIRFCVPFGRHEISGIIDYLTVDDRREILKIGDVKTGWRPNADQLALDIQFSSYHYAVSRPEFWSGVKGSDKYTGFPNGQELFEKYSQYERRAVWFDIRKPKEYDVGPRGTADLVRLYRCLDSIEAAIEADVFVPDISGITCKWCSYQDICTSYLSETEVGKDLITSLEGAT